MPAKRTPRSVAPKKYRAAPGPDVDLERDDVRDVKGVRIDEQYVRRAVEDVHRYIAAGRPSLTAPGTRSPMLGFRVPASLRAAAERRARREGRNLSELAREALERYLAV